jgi:hypothetical protein
MRVNREKIPLKRFSGHFVLGGLRKFAEQQDAILSSGSNQTVRIFSHTACQGWNGRIIDIRSLNMYMTST